jgi:hypothetical protein
MKGGHFLKNDNILKPIKICHFRSLQQTTSRSAPKLTLRLEGPRYFWTANAWHGYEARRASSCVDIGRKALRLFCWNQRHNSFKFVSKFVYQRADSNRLTVSCNNVLYPSQNYHLPFLGLICQIRWSLKRELHVNFVVKLSVRCHYSHTLTGLLFNRCRTVL